MREIKFRAWDKQRKEMIVVEEIHFKYNSIVYEEGIITSPMKNFEMMQFTGLEDKKGKEIYDGDIVAFPQGLDQDCDKEAVNLEVLWDEDNGLWGLRFYWLYNKIKIFDNKSVKVIGNIYENPEFLKSKEEVSK